MLDAMKSVSVQKISSLVSLYRSNKQHGELEIRIGKYMDGKFVPGVERRDFEQLMIDMQASPSLVGDENWSEVVDYYYNDNNTNIRTRVSFDSQTMTANTEHIVKVLKSDHVMTHNGGEEVSFRVAVSEETPLEDPPAVCIPTFVRIKQRRVFKDIRNGNVVWCYEFSKTWSATSRSSVEHAQHMMPPVYEVECELLDPDGTYMDEKTDDTISTSLIMKSHLLLGESCEEEVFTPVERSTMLKRKRPSNSKTT